MHTTRSIAPALAKGTRVALFVSALAALAAHPVRAQADESEKQKETLTAPRPWETPATLRIQSHNWLDLHVYLVRDGGLKRSLGVVSGPGQAELELPADATLPGSLVQLLVEPIGGGQSYLSQALVINPGERVELIVHNNLSLSTESLARW